MAALQIEMDILRNQMRRESREIQQAILANGGLQAEIERLNLALAVQEARSEGLRAAVDYFKATYPDHPLAAGTGRSFEDGDPETRLYREVFAPAFDAFLRGRGIGDPLEHRHVVAGERPPAPAPTPVAPASRPAAPRPGGGVVRRLFRCAW